MIYCNLRRLAESLYLNSICLLNLVQVLVVFCFAQELDKLIDCDFALAAALGWTETAVVAEDIVDGEEVMMVKGR